jgi:hypothetical protein
MEMKLNYFTKSITELYSLYKTELKTFNEFLSQTRYLSINQLVTLINKKIITDMELDMILNAYFNFMGTQLVYEGDLVYLKAITPAGNELLTATLDDIFFVSNIDADLKITGVYRNTLKDELSTIMTFRLLITTLYEINFEFSKIEINEDDLPF